MHESHSIVEVEKPQISLWRPLIFGHAQIRKFPSLVVDLLVDVLGVSDLSINMRGAHAHRRFGS